MSCRGGMGVVRCARASPATASKTVSSDPAPNPIAAHRFAGRLRDTYPKAVECLRDDLPACFRYPTPDERKQVRTADAIERRFREVRRRTRLVGSFRDRTSMERVLFAILPY